DYRTLLSSSLSPYSSRCLLTLSPFFLPCSFAIRPSPTSTLFPYTTLFRSDVAAVPAGSAASPCSGHRGRRLRASGGRRRGAAGRSEEHTSELQSRFDLVCRLLLEKKTKNCTRKTSTHSSAD